MLRTKLVRNRERQELSGQEPSVSFQQQHRLTFTISAS